MDDKKDNGPKKPALHEIFNGRSRWGKALTYAQLYSAVTPKTLASFAKEDTKKHPHRSFFYAGVLLLFQPIPPNKGGIPTALFVLTALFVRMRLNQWSRDAHDHFKDEFNSKVVLTKNLDYFEADLKKPGTYKFNKKRHALETGKVVLVDSKEVFGCSYRCSRDFYKKIRNKFS